MPNKNKFLLQFIIKHSEGESIVITGNGRTLILKYLPEPGDPKFDDLPSEQLTINEEYYVTFERVQKDKERPFN